MGFGTHTRIYNDTDYYVALVDDEMKDWNLNPSTHAVAIVETELGFIHGYEMTEEQIGMEQIIPTPIVR